MDSSKRQIRKEIEPSRVGGATYRELEAMAPCVCVCVCVCFACGSSCSAVGWNGRLVTTVKNPRWVGGVRNSSLASRGRATGRVFSRSFLACRLV